ALGDYTFATGSVSFSMGEDTRAPSYGETAFGLYNTLYTPSSALDLVASDRLFTVGNGVSSAARSNALTILKSGNTGLGTDTPAEKLHLKNPSGSVRMRMESTDHSQIEFRDGSGFRGSIGFSSTEGHLYLYNGGNVALKGGMLGVGTIDPVQKLDVDGNARIRSIGSGAYSGPVNRMADGTLTTATSDLRLKENVRTLQGGLEKIMRLRGVTFTWKEQPGDGTRIGFIAQEMEQVIPELVFTNPTDGYLGVNYAEVSAVLVEAIKAQQALIEALQSENSRLKADMAALQSTTERRLSLLEKLLSTADQ
ncbi:MAG TPA: tail fiber domain-containing protein, partial [Prolixibacteraceae bacterium]|nr:tail fiber domain-containing protein [Prolixibacteraceae bacterium]